MIQLSNFIPILALTQKVCFALVQLYYTMDGMRDPPPRPAPHVLKLGQSLPLRASAILGHVDECLALLEQKVGAIPEKPSVLHPGHVLRVPVLEAPVAVEALDTISSAYIHAKRESKRDSKIGKS